MRWFFKLIILSFLSFQLFKFQTVLAQSSNPPLSVQVKQLLEKIDEINYKAASSEGLEDHELLEARGVLGPHLGPLLEYSHTELNTYQLRRVIKVISNLGLVNAEMDRLIALNVYARSRSEVFSEVLRCIIEYLETGGSLLTQGQWVTLFSRFHFVSNIGYLFDLYLKIVLLHSEKPWVQEWVLGYFFSFFKENIKYQIELRPDPSFDALVKTITKMHLSDATKTKFKTLILTTEMLQQKIRKIDSGLLLEKLDIDPQLPEFSHYQDVFNYIDHESLSDIKSLLVFRRAALALLNKFIVTNAKKYFPPNPSSNFNDDLWSDDIHTPRYDPEQVRFWVQGDLEFEEFFINFNGVNLKPIKDRLKPYFLKHLSFLAKVFSGIKLRQIKDEELRETLSQKKWEVQFLEIFYDLLYLIQEFNFFDPEIIEEVSKTWLEIEKLKKYTLTRGLISTRLMALLVKARPQTPSAQKALVFLLSDQTLTQDQFNEIWEILRDHELEQKIADSATRAHLIRVLSQRARSQARFKDKDPIPEELAIPASLFMDANHSLFEKCRQWLMGFLNKPNKIN